MLLLRRKSIFSNGITNKKFSKKCFIKIKIAFYTERDLSV